MKVKVISRIKIINHWFNHLLPQLTVPKKDEFKIKINFSNWFEKYKVITLKRDMIWMLLLVLNETEKLKRTRNITVEDYEIVFNEFLKSSRLIDSWKIDFKDFEISSHRPDPLLWIRIFNKSSLGSKQSLLNNKKILQIEQNRWIEKYDKFISHILGDEIYWYDDDDDDFSLDDHINSELKDNPKLQDCQNMNENSDYEYNDDSYSDQNFNSNSKNSSPNKLNDFEF